MGERHDLPKIKPDEQPSIVNHGAGSGAAAGGIAGATLGGAMFAKDMIDVEMRGLHKTGAVGIIGAAVGAVLGGLSMKAKQEREVSEGRVVKTPAYLNRGLLSGLGVFVAFNVTNTALGKAGNTLLPREVSSLVGFGAMTIGSIMRKNELQRDFDKAVAIRDANHAKTRQLIEAAVTSAQAPTVPATDEVSYKNTITPDEAAVLLEKQAQAPAPVVEQPAHGPHHAAHTEHASHAEKHEHHQHTGTHADKHESTASHTDHAAKPEAGMAMGA